jgi:bud emergence protein 1
VKGEKDTRPHHISIPPKDAIAIVPPKKVSCRFACPLPGAGSRMRAPTDNAATQVIKALYDYSGPPDAAPNSGFLSFSTGDFLHVIGRENDKEWYEACNPLHGARGLVPVTYFDEVGKTVRDSAGSAKSTPANQSNAPHDSGYQERSITSPTGTDASGSIGRMSRSMGMGGMGGMGGMAGMAAMMKGTGAMVYGIVMYDFKAEGEAIIVIAQSNPEWFVAKPITRLGGPGLIPVSFIEIRDMTSGKAVTDPHEAVRRAGVPKVEEWKKMAADYKNGSIPLGKLEANSQQTLQQGMERMSLSGKSQASGAANGGYGQASSVSFA